MYLRNILKEKELSYNEGFVSISLPVALYNYRVMDVRESFLFTARAVGLE